MTTGKGKDLWLFTMRFPYGGGETMIGTELPYLCERFDRVLILPLFTDGTARPVPSNAEVRKVLPDPYEAAGPLDLLRDLKRWRALSGSVRRSAPSSSILRKRWPEVRSMARQAIHRARVLEGTLFREFDPDRTVLYSFWTADWATVLGLLRASDQRVRFVGRMQGFDLYAERDADGWPPFRAFQLDHVDHLHVTSRTGLNYLRNAYPEHHTLFEYSPLGTDDHGPAPWSPSPVLRIVSVANLIPLKRVHLLAEALKLLDIPVEWTHFGDGTERVRIETLLTTMPAHIQVDLKGRIPHHEVLKWYQHHPVDLFVHTSETEGLPLSMKEAASFGVPMLATDAGGVKEIVHERTGVLLPKDADPAMIARQLAGHMASERNGPGFRAGCRAWWQANFEARVAYGRFCDRLLAEHSAMIERD